MRRVKAGAVEQVCELVVVGCAGDFSEGNEVRLVSVDGVTQRPLPFAVALDIPDVGREQAHCQRTKHSGNSSQLTTRGS